VGKARDAALGWSVKVKHASTAQNHHCTQQPQPIQISKEFFPSNVGKWEIRIYMFSKGLACTTPL